MSANLTETETIPTNYVTRDQLIAFIRSMLAIEGAFCDGITIQTNVDGRLEVGVIDIDAVTLLQDALDAKQDQDAFLDAIAGTAATAGLVARVAPNAAELIPVSTFARTMLDDASAAAVLSTIGAHPAMAQGAAVADPVTAPPADGAIAALTSSATTTQAEFNALRDLCETLRDALAATNTALQALRDRFKVTGGNALIAD